MAQSLFRLIRRILWVLLGVALIFFAVKNRHTVEISFDPFLGSFHVKLWIVLFAGIFIGLMVSAAVTGWLRLESFAKRRKAERRADYLGEQMAAMAEDAHTGRALKAHTAAGDTEPSSAPSSALAKAD